MNRRIAIACLFILSTVGTPLVGCGDYRPCEVLAHRICTQCPTVAEHWEAACLCINNDSLRERGYKCSKATDEERRNCHQTLEEWDEDSCALLSQ